MLRHSLHLFLLLLTTASLMAALPDKSELTTQHQKPLIFVFTSTGGGAHSTALTIIKGLLEEHYNLYEIKPIQDFIGNIEGEENYNLSLQGRIDLATRWKYQYGGPLYVWYHWNSIVLPLQRLISEKKPQLLLSLIPLFNAPIAAAAQQHKLPFIAATLDTDLGFWLNGMQPYASYPHLHFTVGTQSPTTTGLLTQIGIPEKNIHATGFPTRQEFLIKADDKHAARKAWNLPLDNYTVMFFMGGSGSKKLYEMAKEFAKRTYQKPTTLLFCVGKDTKTGEKITKLFAKSQANLTARAIGWTKSIHQIMATSDILVTKPGPGSVNEGLHMQLPLLIDMSPYQLSWEVANAELVVQNGWGKTFEKYRTLPDLVEAWRDRPTRLKVKRTIKKTFPLSRFAQEFPSLVQKVLQEANEHTSVKASGSNTIEQPQTGA